MGWRREGQAQVAGRSEFLNERMIDAREAIHEVQVQAEDEAYWAALERTLGRITARTLRATFRTKWQAEGLRERERFSIGLSRLYAGPSRYVEVLARKEALAKAPRPRGAAIEDLGLHEHWIDFSSPSQEVQRALPFIRKGIAHGAKVVALLSSDNATAYRDAVYDAGHADEVEQGRFTIFSADDHVGVLRSAGLLAVVILAIQAIIQAGRAQGYSEVWFVSKIAPALLAGSQEYLDLVLRFEAAVNVMIRAFPTNVYCPFPDQLPGTVSMISDLLHHHTWGSVADVAIALNPSTLPSADVGGPHPARSSTS